MKNFGVRYQLAVVVSLALSAALSIQAEAERVKARCLPGAPFQLSAAHGVSTPGESYIYGVTAGDLNRDGRTDLVAASNMSNLGGLLVVYANGPRSFGAPQGIASMTGRFHDVALVDINRDARLDVVGVTEFGDLYQFINTTQGFQQSHAGITVQGFTGQRYFLDVAAINTNDSYPDLVVSGRGTVQVLYGFNGGFTAGPSYSKQGRFRAGYFNSDSSPDLVAVADNGYGPELTTLLSSGNGFIELNTPLPVEGKGLAVARLNSDQLSDLYIVNGGNSQTISAYRQASSSTFQSLRTVDRPDFYSNLIESADLDFDGLSDAVADGYGGDTTLLLNRESAAREYAVPLYLSYDILLTDLDRDGKTDVVLGGLTFGSDQSIAVLYNQTACNVPVRMEIAHRCDDMQC